MSNTKDSSTFTVFSSFLRRETVMRNASTVGAIQPGLSGSKHGSGGRPESRHNGLQENELQGVQLRTLGKIDGVQGEFRQYCKRYVLEGCVDHPSVKHCSCTPAERRQRMFDKRERLVRSLDRILDEFYRERSFAEN